MGIIITVLRCIILLFSFIFLLAFLLFSKAGIAGNFIGIVHFGLIICLLIYVLLKTKSTKFINVLRHIVWIISAIAVLFLSNTLSKHYKVVYLILLFYYISIIIFMIYDLKRKQIREEIVEKKRPVGIIVVGIVILFSNLIVLLFLKAYHGKNGIFFGRLNILSLIEIVIYLIFTTFFAIRLFYLKEYARIGLIVFMCLGIFSDTIRSLIRISQVGKLYTVGECVKMRTNFTISLILALVIYILVIYYLTRPKVKEQFK